MKLPKLLYSMPDFYCPECGTKMRRTKDLFYNYCPKCKKEVQIIKRNEKRTEELRKLLS